jgi:hypothetical protein
VYEFYRAIWALLRDASVTEDEISSPVQLSALMELPIARHARQSDQLVYSPSTVCKIRTDLLDRLAGALENLVRATLGLTSAMKNRDAVQDELAQFEIERLQSDCADIRVELKCHREQHGC